MRYLPVSFNTNNKNVLVLGGGLLALSKIKKLINTDFKIYIISDIFVDEIKDMESKYPEKIFTKEETLSENFIFFNYDYVIIATTDFELNNKFELRAKKTNTLYERCDISSDSSMIMNESIEKNGIVLGIDTNKINPTIANIIYKDLEKFLDKYDENKINILNKIRTELVRKNASNIDDTILKLYKEEKISLNDYLEKIKKDNVESLEHFDNLNNKKTEKFSNDNSFPEDIDNEDKINKN